MITWHCNEQQNMKDKSTRRNRVRERQGERRMDGGRKREKELQQSQTHQRNQLIAQRSKACASSGFQEQIDAEYICKKIINEHIINKESKIHLFKLACLVVHR